ncbi:oligosaccharide repeat unit polymerase [Arthrobacter sp. IA7]|uniref:O-antigen polysaccharide polymerase Wzy n=1 Tax=Arthrobacter ipis TaxID=2716202 RepID=UPI00168915FE|nr:O-antigen polysaccharide polymerase Wzy [Arthrobacter ipis]MBD1541858.1 oligosaccharide repeat unit polymerase [Arthrobacter ipis]
MEQNLEPARLGLLAALAAVAFGLLLVRLSRGPVGPLSSIALITYCQILIFVARPAFAIVYQDSRNIFTLNPYDDFVLHAQIYAGLGYIALCVGYAIKSKPVRGGDATSKPIRAFTDETWSRLVVPIYVVVAVGYGLYTLYVLQVGWSAYWAATLSGRSPELRSALNSNSGYLYSGLQFATGALMLVVYQAALKGQKVKALVLVAMLVLSVFPQIASGSRSVFIPVGVGLLFILHSVKPSVMKMSRVALWGPVAFVLGFVAPRIWRDNLATGGSIVDSLRVAVEPENLFDNFFGGLDTAMIDSYALQIAAQQQGEISYQLGSTYLGLFSSVIPRALWPGKPVSVDELLNAVLFPATDAKNIGFAFGVYSEPTLNFGLLGVIFIPLLVGLALGALTNRVKASNYIVPSFVLLMVTSYVFPIMRGSISFDSQRLLISLAPVLIVLLLFHRDAENGDFLPDRRAKFLKIRRPAGAA